MSFKHSKLYTTVIALMGSLFILAAAASPAAAAQNCSSQFNTLNAQVQCLLSGQCQTDSIESLLCNGTDECLFCGKELTNSNCSNKLGICNADLAKNSLLNRLLGEKLSVSGLFQLINQQGGNNNFKLPKLPAKTPVLEPAPNEPSKPAPTPPEEEKKPQNPAPAPTQASLSAMEREMLSLVNGERTKAGLSTLTADSTLSKVARIKSQDMLDKNYFDHNSPTYGTPFEMMKGFGISYSTAGENIALNSSVEKAHIALMNSPGHKANILNSSFTHIGLGIVQKANGSLYITQMFIGK